VFVLPLPSSSFINHIINPVPTQELFASTKSIILVQSNEVLPTIFFTLTPWISHHLRDFFGAHLHGGLLA
jgi:hypothetical protein